MPRAQPIPARLNKSQLANLICGGNNHRLICAAIETAGLKATAGGKFCTRDAIQAVYRLKSGVSAADRRNEAHADLLELQASVIREDRPKMPDVLAAVTALGAAFNRALDDERFPQEWRDDAVDAVEAAVARVGEELLRKASPHG